MISNVNEREFYKTVYLLAFDKNEEFFHSSSYADICLFLNENFFGDNLKLRIQLLSRLLYFDSIANPKIGKDLVSKSKELQNYLNLIPK